MNLTRDKSRFLGGSVKRRPLVGSAFALAAAIVVFGQLVHESLQRKRVALKQRLALLEGKDIPPAFVIEGELEEEEIDRKQDRAQDRQLEAMWLGTPGWEANPNGLSGRMIRGYRDWRHKR